MGYERSMAEDLGFFMESVLKIMCPVLSGNMKSHIKVEKADRKEVVISVSGPSYDFDVWRKTKQIDFTHEYDYAVSVNNLGAFQGKSTKSKHWANKAVFRACSLKADEYGAEVVCNVEI